jgi:excinuclease ABC subunit C
VNIPEPEIIDPLAATLLQQLSTLGKRSGIYAFASSHKITHLGWSTHLARRLQRLLCARDGGRSDLAVRLSHTATTVQYWRTTSRLESSLLLHQLAKASFPHDYLARLRLRMPWFVALTDTNHFARLTVTNRLKEKQEPTIGPFPSRDAAQRYQEELLASFSIRRCAEPLNPAPEHPGCIYGEMNLCLRPCQCAVGEEEYRTEADSVKDLLLTNGRNTLHFLSLKREKAASELEFERAAQIHKRMERLKGVVKSRDEIVTDVANFSGVAVTRGPEDNQFRLWPLLAGYWQEPVTLEVPVHGDAKAASLDRRLRDLLVPVFLHPRREGQPGEDLAVFARWHYSSWRDGDWIACVQFDGAACRKVLRSISKLSKETAKDELAIGC